MRKRSNRSIIFALVVIATLLSVCAYAFWYHANAPLAQREDKTVYTPLENVKIDAATFNGDIEIQVTSGNQIEIIYTITAPDGYLSDVTTSTNENKTDNLTTLTATSLLLSSDSTNYKANLLIKVPNTNKYNLTLTTANGNIIKPQLNDTTVVATTNKGNIDIKDGGASEIDAMTLNGNINIGLMQNTLFQVAASVGNGKITHQGISLDTSTDTATRLMGTTTGGKGNLTLALVSGNGDITVEYSQ
ncbi:MAG: hypothetical protein NWE92_03525 [Candidatus Bathyarchaeota archaeon]|nr:hypothetical protein [Candidatus Bathyarchaeota archaeon]